MIAAAVAVLFQVGAVRGNRPDVKIAGTIGLEGDSRTIGGPVRLAEIVEITCQTPGQATTDRHCPQDAEQIERNHAAIGRDRQGDIGSLLDLDRPAPRRGGAAGCVFRQRYAAAGYQQPDAAGRERSEAHTSELQSLMRDSYAVFCLKKK